jgi:hypothetical protein
MKLKADCFDANVEIRDLARVVYAELMFESFEGKDQAYITDRALNDVLFLYAGNTETMLSQINLLKGILNEADFKDFIENLAKNAIMDNAYEKCDIILKNFVNVRFKVYYERLGIFDIEKVEFLESVKDYILIFPFFDFNFNTNKIGLDGYCKLLKLTDKDSMEFKILHEKGNTNTLRYLLSGINHGYLEGYFSENVSNVITASSLTEFLEEDIDARYKNEAICDYTDSELLGIFCNAMDACRNREYLADGLRAAYKIRSQFS